LRLSVQPDKIGFIMALISLRSVAPARDLASDAGYWPHPARPIAAPTPSYPGQLFDPLYVISPPNHTELPGVELRLGLIENATVVVRQNYDGIILDKHGAAVRETTYFTDIFAKKIDKTDIEVEGKVSDLDEVFISFDGAWHVYYHWLIFCLGSAGVANKMLPGAISIAIPDWVACGSSRPSIIPRRVFEEVKRVVDPRRLLNLRDGIYSVRRAYFFYMDGDQASDIAMHPLYKEVFNGLTRNKKDEPPRSRIFVSRGGRGHSDRVTASDEKIFDEIMLEYNVKKVTLEHLSFRAQIDHFSRSNLIIAPHGSGLANLVFTRPSAKVVELQTEFAGPGLLLPWFYRLAAGSDIDYAFLNREAGDFQAERLRESLAALGISRPKQNSALKALRRARRRLDAASAWLRWVAVPRLQARLARICRGRQVG